MAPEMVIDRQYDGRKADFWSMGCILLELLLTAKEFSTMWMKNFQVLGRVLDALDYTNRDRGLDLEVLTLCSPLMDDDDG